MSIHFFVWDAAMGGRTVPEDSFAYGCIAQVIHGLQIPASNARKAMAKKLSEANNSTLSPVDIETRMLEILQGRSTHHFLQLEFAEGYPDGQYYGLYYASRSRQDFGHICLNPRYLQFLEKPINPQDTDSSTPPVHIPSDSEPPSLTSSYQRCIAQIHMMKTLYHELAHMFQDQIFLKDSLPYPNPFGRLKKDEPGNSESGLAEEDVSIQAGEFQVAFDKGYVGEWEHARSLEVFRDGKFYYIQPAAYSSIQTSFPDVPDALLLEASKEMAGNWQDVVDKSRLQMGCVVEMVGDESSKNPESDQGRGYSGPHIELEPLENWCGKGLSGVY